MTADRDQLLARLGADAQTIEESFVRASGPGGQNVNKVATAVRLRCDLTRCRKLSPECLARLRRLAGRRLTGDDVIVITAQRYRTQDRNRADAWQRLEALVDAALVQPRTRRRTRPTHASRERRLEKKSQQSERKRLRARLRKPEDG